MKLLAHRGASREFSENTMPAFRRAAEIGVDEIETDLRMTRDDVIVLHHDETIPQTAGGVRLRDLTWSELYQRCPSIPTLEDALQEVGRQADFCLELKEKGLVEPLVSLIRRLGLQSRVHWTSFDADEVMLAHRLLPEAPFSRTFSSLPLGIESELKEQGVSQVSLSSNQLSQETVQRLKHAGIQCRVYTVNDLILGQEYQSWGVHAIFTDDPAGMKSLQG